MSTLAPEPQPVEIELQLDRILASKIFRSAQRSRAFLRYVVVRTLAGSIPKEYEIAVDILGRGSDYDPSVDAAVRVEAGRLRSRLREYYTTDGMNDPVHIEIRKGGYAAVFSPRESREQVPAVQKYVSDSATVAHTETAKNGVAQPKTEVPIAKPSEIRHGHKTRWLVTTACVVMVIAVAAWQMQKRSVAAMPIRSLAVIPLENLSGDPSQDYFADGMTDELITELARLPSLRVVSRTSVMQDKDTHKPLQQIARELDVDAIVEGSIVRSGDKVRITAQLIDARNDRHLWAQSFEGRVSDILSLQDSVARDIAAQAKVALMPGAQFESGVIKSIDPAAHDAYMRGRFFLNKREAEKSTAYFREALTIDPKYAAAYAGLASALESESTLEMVKPEDAMPKATEAARRSLGTRPQKWRGLYGAWQHRDDL